MKLHSSHFHFQSLIDFIEKKKFLSHQLRGLHSAESSEEFPLSFLLCAAARTAIKPSFVIQ